MKSCGQSNYFWFWDLSFVSQWIVTLTFVSLDLENNIIFNIQNSPQNCVGYLSHTLQTKEKKKGIKTHNYKVIDWSYMRIGVWFNLLLAKS